MGHSVCGLSTTSKVTRVNRPRTFRYLSQFFSLELKNSNFRCSGNLLSFDLDESLYSEFWSSYLFSNFLNMCGSQKVETSLLILSFNLIFYNCHWKLSTQWEVIMMNKDFAHTSKQQNVVQIISSCKSILQFSKC